MDETQFVNGFNRQDTLRHIKPRNIFSECIILDEHGHEIATREELHDEIKIHRILEGVVK